MTNSANNQPQYLSVTTLTKYISAKFNNDPYLDRVFVKGEVSNYRPRKGVAQYLTLKDKNSQLSAVMFANVFNKLQFKLEDGQEVLVTGRVTVYEPYGNYQIVIDSIQPDGVGALYLALEQLKEKMRKEGLFDRPKKRIPIFPKKIAVITSPTGSVIRDILTTIKRRFPIVDVTVFPTRVQGERAVSEIINAFNLVEKHKDEYDTVILARGGGSIEDLWCFNDEKVAHAILNCSLPVISSIGHETDTTIADLVADLRAPTPTAAAEQSVPVLVDVLNWLNQTQQRLYSNMNQRLEILKKRLSRSSDSYVFKKPESMYQAYQQQLDLSLERLTTFTNRKIEAYDYRVKSNKQKLLAINPERKINEYSARLQKADQAFNYQIENILNQASSQLARLTGILDAHSPLKTIARGYSILENEDGEIIKSVENVEKGDEVYIQLADGRIEAQVNDKEAEVFELGGESDE